MATKAAMAAKSMNEMKAAKAMKKTVKSDRGKKGAVAKPLPAVAAKPAEASRAGTNGSAIERARQRAADKEESDESAPSDGAEVSDGWHHGFEKSFINEGAQVELQCDNRMGVESGQAHLRIEAVHPPDSRCLRWSSLQRRQEGESQGKVVGCTRADTVSAYPLNHAGRQM